MSQSAASRPVECLREETRDEHADLLAAFLGDYRPLEGRLGPAVGRHLPSFPFWPRAGRLEGDLQTLGMSDDAFFGVPAERTRTRWEQFQEVLDQHVSTDGAVSAAVTTARATFRVYREWLSGANAR